MPGLVPFPALVFFFVACSGPADPDGGAGEAGADAGAPDGSAALGDRDGDGSPETYPAVPPSTPVCFDVIVRRNETVMPTDTPQVFQAQIDVVGDGVTVLDTRDVYFLVPPNADTSVIF